MSFEPDGVLYISTTSPWPKQKQMVDVSWTLMNEVTWKEKMRYLRIRMDRVEENWTGTFFLLYVQRVLDPSATNSFHGNFLHNIWTWISSKCFRCHGYWARFLPNAVLQGKEKGSWINSPKCGKGDGAKGPKCAQLDNENTKFNTKNKITYLKMKVLESFAMTYMQKEPSICGKTGKTRLHSFETCKS